MSHTIELLGDESDYLLSHSGDAEIPPEGPSVIPQAGTQPKGRDPRNILVQVGQLCPDEIATPFNEKVMPSPVDDIELQGCFHSYVGGVALPEHHYG